MEDLNSLSKEQLILKLKSAEERLSKLEDSGNLDIFKTLVTNTEEIIYYIDSDGIFQLSEGKGLLKLGLASGEVVGSSVYDLYKDFPEMLDSMRRVFLGETITNEVDIGGIYFRNWYTPQFDDNGRVLGLLGLSVDITEQKFAQDRISRYSKIFEDSLNEIYLFNSDNLKFIQVNNAALKNLGFTIEEIQKITPIDIKPEFTIELFSELILPLVNREKEVIEFETIHQRKDGSLYNVNVHLQLLDYNKEQIFAAIILDITDKKNASRELSQRDAKFKKILENTPLPLCYVNSENIISFRNNRFIKLFGYDEKEVPGLPEWWAKAYPDDQYRSWVENNWQEAVEKAAKTGDDIESEVYNVTCKNGELRSIIISGIVVEDDFIATFIDITDQKKADDELKKLITHQANIIEGTNAGTWMWDIKNGGIIINGIWAQMVGYTLAELTPFNFEIWTNMIHPDDLEPIKKLVNRHFNGELKYYDAIFRQRHKNGHWIWIHARGKIVEWDEQGNPSKMGGTHLEITNQKEAELKLLEEKQFSEEIINSLPGLFYQISSDAEFIYLSKEFEKITGYSNSELSQMSPIDLFSGSDKELIAERIKESFEKGRSFANASLTKKNCDKAPYFFSGSRVFKDGNPILVGMGIDISELKEAEEELRHHREHLEEMIVERTEELELKNKELDSAMKVFVGREQTIRELEKKIRILKGGNN